MDGRALDVSISTIDDAVDELSDSARTGYMSDSKSAVYAIELQAASLPVSEATLEEIVGWAKRTWAAVSGSGEVHQRVALTLVELVRLRRYVESLRGDSGG